MKLNFDLPKQKTIQDETIFNRREVIISNRKYKCLTFLSEDEVNEYLDKHPKYEVLSIDSEGINIIPLDSDGIEVEFIPYEFKKHREGFLPLDERELLSSKRKSFVDKIKNK